VVTRFFQSLRSFWDKIIGRRKPHIPPDILDKPQPWTPLIFPISYWWGPTYDDPAGTRYQQVVDAGFTLAGVENMDQDSSLNLKFLNEAGAVGLKGFVADTRIAAIVNRGISDVDLGISTFDDDAKQTIDAVIADYSRHPALAGYFLSRSGGDEMSPSAFPVLKALVAYLREKDPRHPCWINIYPNYPDSVWGAGTYEEYLESYITTVKPSFICYDNYANMKPLPNLQEFFDNLRIVGQKAKDHSIPFWDFVLLTRHWDYRQPTAAEKRFEVMQSLAYGAEGVLYFTYQTPSSDDSNFNGWGEGIVLPNGTPSSQYAEVKAINADVRAIGEYLLTAQFTMVIESGNPRPPDMPIEFLSPVDVTVGLFELAPHKYILLANRDYQKPIFTLVMFYGGSLEQLDKASGNWKYIMIPEEGAIFVSLAAGDAELYRYPHIN
jgi:hypothetical protein